MVNCKDNELTAIESDEEKKKIKRLLKRILDSVKALSTFFAKILYEIYTEGLHESNRRTEDFFAMCILMNSLLRSKFVYYCIILYLSRVLIYRNKQSWLVKRQKLKSDLSCFDDLIYMKSFISEEESQIKLRASSVAHLRTSSVSRNVEKIEQMTPQGMHRLLKSSLFLDTEEARASQLTSFRGSSLNHNIALSNGQNSSILSRQNATPKHVQMNMEEFLVHLNLHLKMNLDYVFSQDLREILKFFTAIEDFMEKTFGNQELEIKIDMMRLVVRMTNATVFIDKIYMLNQMNIKYLEYWQTFSLFTQVLMSELLSSEQSFDDDYVMKKKERDANMNSLYQVDEEEREEREFTSPIRLDELGLDTPFRKKAFNMNVTGFDLSQTQVEGMSVIVEGTSFYDAKQLRMQNEATLETRVERNIDNIGVLDSERIQGEEL